MIEACKSLKPLVLLFALCLLGVGTAGAQVAEVFVEPDRIIFEVFAENDGLTFSVAGPCGVVTTTYKRGETPVLYNVDESGAPLDDGTYTWQLDTVPFVDSGLKEAMQTARIKGTDEEFALYLLKEGLLPQTLTQFGYLTVVDGKFVLPGTEKAGSDQDISDPFAKDFVILDDLIVDGSACIGFDCVNGENFGFDTLRLKENNLRIKFEDTSVAASYPTNDWQLTANDSANGGASKFSIDDISGGRTPFTVEARAPSHSLYVDDGGRVGLGTSTPVADIHAVSGNTPTLRLEQNGSSGFAPQTWDVAGNEANFFIRDATNGSTLPFRIRPGAPSSALSIDADGDVGVGTFSPDADLHVVGEMMLSETDAGNNPAEVLEIEMSADNTARIRFDDGNQWNIGGGAGSTFIITEAGNPAQFLLDNAGDLTIGGTLTENSDVNAKENFASVNRQEILAKVLELPITTWTYKADEDAARHLGPMAQDFFSAFELGGTDNGIAPRNVAGVALVAIQGLNEQLEAKDAQIADLTARLAALEAAFQAQAEGN